jgi:hypothetical protein
MDSKDSTDLFKEETGEFWPKTMTWSVQFPCIVKCDMSLKLPECLTYEQRG